MLRKSYVVLVIALFSIILLLSSAALGRTALGYDGKDSDRGFVAQEPDQCSAMHDVGELLLSVNNNGTFGTSYAKSQDCFTNEPIPAGGCEYPKGSGQQYNYGSAFWVGAIVGRDTLVSVGHDGWQHVKEFYPEPAPFGHMIRRSTIDPNDPMYENAISEQDYVAVYMDTFPDRANTQNYYSGGSHTPINIKVTQNSYAWSYSYAEDLILFDYKIKNIGIQELEDVYMGIYVDADVGDVGDEKKYLDDICGFLPYYRYYYGPNDMCSYEDNPFIAWIADDDGNLNEDNPALSPTPHVTATRIVRTPAKKLNVSFNWWVSNGNTAYDFGPRLKGTEENPFRDFRFGGLGTPERDDNKYHV
ncbi:MAG: hypothetical protein U9N55_03895, partial [candidate division Zixibacteria bacterium]|nr:hypothetical protein [candidate division Zixibacteria bacterium]